MSLTPSTVGRRLLILTMFSQRRPQILRYFGINFKHDTTDIFFLRYRLNIPSAFKKSFLKLVKHDLQKLVFKVCSTISRPLVNAALNGFNGTLMAYGQTGSGMNFEFLLSSFRGVTGRGGVGENSIVLVSPPL